MTGINGFSLFFIGDLVQLFGGRAAVLPAPVALADMANIFETHVLNGFCR